MKSSNIPGSMSLQMLPCSTLTGRVAQPLSPATPGLSDAISRAPRGFAAPSTICRHPLFMGGAGGRPRPSSGTPDAAHTEDATARASAAPSRPISTDRFNAEKALYQDTINRVREEKLLLLEEAGVAAQLSLGELQELVNGNQNDLNVSVRSFISDPIYRARLYLLEFADKGVTGIELFSRKPLMVDDELAVMLPPGTGTILEGSETARNGDNAALPEGMASEIIRTALRPLLEASSFARTVNEVMLGNRWVLYHSRALLQTFEQHPRFRLLDTRKKIYIIHQVIKGLVRYAHGILQHPREGFVISMSDDTNGTKLLLENALQKQRLDPADFADLTHTITRQEAYAEEGDALRAQYKKVREHIMGMSVPGLNVSEQYKELAHHLLLLWHATPGDVQKMLLYRDHQIGGLPSRWIDYQLEQSGPDTATAPRSVELSQAITRRRKAKAAALQYFDGVLTAEHVKTCRVFGSACMNAEFAKQYFPYERIIGGGLEIARLGIFDPEISRSLNLSHIDDLVAHHNRIKAQEASWLRRIGAEHVLRERRP